MLTGGLAVIRGTAILARNAAGQAVLQEFRLADGSFVVCDAGIGCLGQNGTSTGTVYEFIAATQPVYPGTVIPRSFEMTLPNGQRVWVAENATEHMAEFARMKAVNFPPEVVRLASQLQLASLQGAVNTATRNGVAYNQILNVGG